MRDAACDTGVIIADAVALAELPGGTGHERVRIDWLNKRLAAAPGSRHVDGVGNLVWTFGPPPYRLAVLVHVDDVFGEQTARGVIRRDGWLCGPGIGDNAIAVATAVAVIERALAAPGEKPLAVVFTVGEEGLGGLRGARHACRELAPEAVLALEGHGSDRVFTDAVGSLRVRLTVTGPGGHSWWDRGRASAVHELVRLLTGMIASVPAPLSVNVGLLDGGTGVNAIAARASATVEWRATDQAALDRQEAALAELTTEVSPTPWSPRSCAPAARSGCRTRRATDRPTRTRRSRPAYRPSPSAAASARTCTPRPSGSGPTPSPPALASCRPCWPRSWTNPPIES